MSEAVEKDVDGLPGGLPVGLGDTVSVLLPIRLDRAYDYEVPEGVSVQPGAFVQVPLGSRSVTGVVWGAGDGDVDRAKLKAIELVYPAPPMSEDLQTFVDWVAEYTFSTPGQVLGLTMRSRAALEGPKMAVQYRWDGGEPERMTGARARVMDVARDGLMRPLRGFCEEAGVSDGVVRGLIKLNILHPIEVPVDAPFAVPDPEFPGHTLSEAQTEVAGDLVARVRGREFSVALIDGVTGSGKTETYLEAVAEALRQGRQALVLLPEIALSMQVYERFAARFGVAPAAWHSEMSSNERRRTWRAVAGGEARVVVGARSALFLPFQDLGLIVVDEEHDATYKQDDGVVYHARDMAIVRGRISKAPVVLASATPSLETIVNVDSGRYDCLELPSRHGNAQLPDISMIDMRAADLPSDQWLAPELVQAITETIASGDQVLLYLNRRGYAPLTLCRKCGHRMMSPDSSSWLVEHRFKNRLVCHHSGYWIPKPKRCPACDAEDSLAACGPGVERISEEVARLFPDLRMEVMSSDTVHGPAQIAELIKRMEDGEIDLLIGTQVVAKGHHFPALTLVGVVDADLGLKGGDLRAAERTYQLLHQVAGRAGRGDRPGRVLLQTYMPDHPVMEALADGGRDDFLAREAEEREILNMPPFGRLAALVLSGPEASEVEQIAQGLVRQAPRSDQVVVLGPSPAPIAILRGRFRHRILVKATKEINLQAYLSAWLSDIKLPTRIRLRVDVDSYSFL